MKKVLIAPKFGLAFTYKLVQVIAALFINLVFRTEKVLEKNHLHILHPNIAAIRKLFPFISNTLAVRF